MCSCPVEVCETSSLFIFKVKAVFRQDMPARGLLPEEWFMQTYGQAAGFAGKFSKHGCLRYVDWSAKGPHPANLRKKDYAAILNSKAFLREK